MPDPGGDVVVAAVGDLMINRDEPASLFDHCRGVLAGADVTFGNCESVYSENGARNPAARGEIRAHPRNAEALRTAGFDAVTFANNHHLDSGYDAFFRTLEVLDDLEIAVCGAGGDWPPPGSRRSSSATAPGSPSSGTRRSCSPAMRPTGQAGLRPLRAYTHYQQIEIEQPGSQPEIRTFVHDEDLDALVADVRRAKDAADVVIVSPPLGGALQPGRDRGLRDGGRPRGHRRRGRPGAWPPPAHPQGGAGLPGQGDLHGLGNFAVDCAHNAIPGTESPALLEMQGSIPSTRSAAGRVAGVSVPSRRPPHHDRPLPDRRRQNPRGVLRSLLHTGPPASPRR